MHIVRAQPDDAALLTKIAFAAKRHWGYPEKWLESWRELPRIRPVFISRHETYSAILEGRTVGFYALEHQPDRLNLAHLRVLPEVMGRGLGRSLFHHALERARALEYRKLEMESDPHAEGFYLRMGARRVGVNLAEMDGQRRELAVLVCEVNHPAAGSSRRSGTR
jgi:predicted N-acetyltransferase YhbS